MKKQKQTATGGAVLQSGFRRKLGLIGTNWELYVMIVPVIIGAISIMTQN